MSHAFITIRLYVTFETGLSILNCGHLTNQSCIPNPFVLHNSFHGLVSAVEQWMVSVGFLIKEEDFRSSDWTLMCSHTSSEVLRSKAVEVI